MYNNKKKSYFNNKFAEMKFGAASAKTYAKLKELKLMNQKIFRNNKKKKKNTNLFLQKKTQLYILNRFLGGTCKKEIGLNFQSPLMQ